MKRSTRIKQLFQIPSYRTRLGLFLTIGGLLISISLLAPIDPKWQNLGTNIATTFIGVGLVSYLWDFLGGDPIETKIVESFDELETKFDSVETKIVKNVDELGTKVDSIETGIAKGVDELETKIDSVKFITQVVSDMTRGNIGMERIWPSRSEWAADLYDGLGEWRGRLCQAHNVSIVSMAFWSNWFDHDAFANGFFRNVSSRTKINLLVYDPESDISAFRAKDEMDPRSKWGFQMQNEIIGTLQKISEALAKLSPHERKFFEVRLSNKSYHLAQIIKADNRILVSTYLAGKSGSSSLTFQIKEPSRYFSTYVEQIDILWNKARPVSYDELLVLTVGS